MLRPYTIALLLSLFLVSCTRETVFQEVKVNNRYSIEIPDYLQPCADIHKDASLQYQNVDKDIYAIVINEKKITMQAYDLDFDIDLYFNSVASQPFQETIKDGKVSPPGRQQINGNKALVVEITGKVEQNEVYYRMAVIESPYEFYQILIWTRADNKDKYLPDMTRMIESFKELPHSPEELPQPKLSDSVTIKMDW